MNEHSEFTTTQHTSSHEVVRVTVGVTSPDFIPAICHTSTNAMLCIHLSIESYNRRSLYDKM